MPEKSKVKPSDAGSGAAAEAAKKLVARKQSRQDRMASIMGTIKNSQRRGKPRK